MNKKLFLSLILIIGLVFIACDTGNTPPPDPDPTPVPVVNTGASKAEAIPLTQGEWADGNIASASGEQWFTFTATANPQYIHFEPGTFSIGVTQLYDASGTAVGDQGLLIGVTSASLTVTSGNVYYIKITPHPNAEALNTASSGTYKIAFGADAPPAITVPTTGVTELTIGTWKNNEIAQFSEQWYKFTAAAATQYIHFISLEGGLFDNVAVQLYDASGAAVGDMATLTSGAFTSKTVTSGTVYYIRVISSGLFSFSGKYKILVANSFTTGSVTNLTTDTVADGSIANVGDAQWFKFTATAATHYILFTKGTMESAQIQLYNTAGATVGDSKAFSGNGFASITVTSGTDYYIKVTAYVWGSEKSGTYTITFSNSFTTGTVTTLTANSWKDGNLAADGEEWFKFTATAATQYIHFTAGTLTYVSVLVYDDTGTSVGYSEFLGGSYSPKYNISRTVTSGNVYYIKVASALGTSSGTYKIAFNTSETAPTTP